LHCGQFFQHATEVFLGRPPHLILNLSTRVMLDLDVRTYGPYALMSSICPTTGQQGTPVTISGSNMFLQSSISDVIMWGVSVQIIKSQTNSQIIVARAAGSVIGGNNGDVKLIAPTEAYLVKEKAFQYIAIGEPLGVQPSQGQYGTAVTINGFKLCGGGSSVGQL
jgi:hypothetical protein